MREFKPSSTYLFEILYELLIDSSGCQISVYWGCNIFKMRENLRSCRSSLIVPRTTFKSITYKTKLNPEQSTTIQTPTCKRKTSTTFWQSREKLIQKGKDWRRRSEATMPNEIANYLSIFQFHMDLKKNIRSLENEESLSKAVITVKLPQVHERVESDFTVLEPLNAPIQYIEDSIESIKRGLIKSKNEIKVIRQQIPHISRLINQNIGLIEKSTRSGLRELRESIRNDCIRHQSFRMEATKGILQNKQYISQVAEGVKKEIQRAMGIQKEMFENQLPFELEMEDEDGQMVERSFF